MRVDATVQKVFFPVEFLHCSKCVSQYLNVCHHTSQRTLPRFEVTSLHYFGREHLNMHPADLDFSMNTSSQKRKLEPSRVPFQQQRRTPPPSTTGIVVQRNKVPSTNTESTRARATVCRPTTASAHEYLDKVSSDSRPTIRPYNDVTMLKKMREVQCSSALLVADLFNQTLLSYHPTLSWTSGPAGMIDGVMTAPKIHRKSGYELSDFNSSESQEAL